MTHSSSPAGLRGWLAGHRLVGLALASAGLIVAVIVTLRSGRPPAGERIMRAAQSRCGEDKRALRCEPQ